MRFRGAASVVAVCDFCRSTLVREGARLEDIGKQSELIEDASPLQLGARGSHNGVPFTIVGRIQYRYQAGAWNEWYILFAGGKGGWLSDPDGKYLVSYLRAPAVVPPFDALKPGAAVALYGEPFEVANTEEAEVVAGEGELPFKFLGGWKARVADLRGARNAFATIDYSDTPPRIYVGEQLPFDTFKFAGLRDPRAQKGALKARAFRCPGCAAPLEKRLATTQTVACGSCGTAIDATQDVVAILARQANHASRQQPSIPLGSRARFQGAEYEVVGYLRRSSSVDGMRYEWGEYLLHSLERGYLWITEYRGHFNMVHACAENPKPVSGLGPPQLSYLGRHFRHFQCAEAKVDYLVGEFNWLVRAGDRCEVNDYVAPPLMLSSEATGSELTWSIAEYVDGENLAKAFGLKKPLPRPQGIYANQPSPHSGVPGRYAKAAALVVLAALVIHAVLWLGTDRRDLHRFEFVAEPLREVRYESPLFEVGGWRPVRLAIAAEAPGLHNGGQLELDYTLVNSEDGRAWATGESMWNASGVQDGEAWHEREVKRVAHVGKLPPGRYSLSVRGVLAGDPKRLAPASTAVRVYRAAPDPWNLLLLALLVCIFPLIAWWRSRSFETARWTESDYASAEGGDDEE